MSQLLKYCLLVVAVYYTGAIAIAQPLKLGIPSGHTDVIEHAQFSRDGRYTITGSEKDKTVRVWETNTGKLIFNISLKEAPVHFEFHPAGNYFLVTTRDSVSIYSNEDGQRLFTIDAGTHTTFSLDGKYILGSDPFARYNFKGEMVNVIRQSQVEGIIQSSDRRLVAVPVNGGWSRPDTVYIHDLTTNRTVRYFTDELKTGLGIDDFCKAMQFSKDGSKIYYKAEPDATLKVMETTTGKLLMQHRDRYDVSAAFHPSGRFIAVADDNVVRIFDLKDGMVVRIVPSKAIQGSESIKKIMYSSSGKYMVVQALDSTRVWDNSNGSHIFSFRNSSFNEISENEKLLLSYTYDNTWATIRRMETGRIQTHLENKAGYGRLNTYTGKTLPLIRSVKSNVLRIWDPVSGKLLNTLTGHKGYVADEDFSPNGKYIVTVPARSQDANKDHVRVWDAATNRQLYALFQDTVSYKSPSSFYTWRFSPDSRYLFLVTNRGEDGLDVFEAATGKKLYEVNTPKHGYYTNLYFNTRGDQFIFGSKSDTDTIGVYETASGKLLNTIRSGYGVIRYAAFHLNDSLIVLKDSSHIQVRRNGSDTILHRFPANTYAYSPEQIFSADGRYAAAVVGQQIRLMDISTGMEVKRMTFTANSIRDLYWSRTGKYLLTVDSDDKICLWNLLKGTIEKELPLKGTFSHNDRYLIAAEDANPVIIDLETGERVATIYAVEEEYLIALGSGYYQSSPGVSRHLYYIQGNKSIGFEQLDIKYNRPDIVLSTLSEVFGSADTALINSYYKAYTKRLQRHNVDAAALGATLQPVLPEAVLVNEDQLPAVTKEKSLQLHIRATDGAGKLSRLNLWLNEIPLFGVAGIDILHRNSNYLDTTVTVTLSQEGNTIEFSVTNTAGMESYRKPLYVDYVPATWIKSRIFFVGIGINEYLDSTKNLALAAKDVRDLAYEFKKRYPDSYIDTFINQRATRQNILAVKKQLLQANEEDIVLISFSGHGMLDKDLNFYCATHDIDFANPSDKGLSYTDLENLLVDLPARKKLILLDACNSGEADSELQQYGGQVNQDTKAEAGSKGFTIRTSKAQQNTYDLMRQMFANTGVRNGLVVISAAGAKEYAFELKDLDNGVFTYCVKKGLFEGEADEDRYGGVSVTELKNYVSRQVEQLTMGRQKPTTRKENLVVDWSLSSFTRGISNSAFTKALFDSAVYFSRTGAYLPALQHYNRLLYQLEADSNYVNLDYAWACINTGDIQKILEDTASALQHYFRALSVTETFGKFTADYDEMLGRIALTFFELREYDSALVYYQQRLPILSKLYDVRSKPYLFALNLVGVIQSWRQQWDSAAFYYQKAWDIILYLGKYSGKITDPDEDQFKVIARNLAIAYGALEDYQREAGAWRELAGWRYTKDEDMRSWAIALEKSGDIHGADSVYRSVINEITGTTWDSNYVSKMIEWREYRAKLNKTHQRYEQALGQYKDLSAFVAQHMPGSERLAFFLNELAIVYERVKDLPAAVDAYKKAMEIYKKRLGEESNNYKIVKGNLEKVEKRMNSGGQ